MSLKPAKKLKKNSEESDEMDKDSLKLESLKIKEEDDKRITIEDDKKEATPSEDSPELEGGSVSEDEDEEEEDEKNEYEMDGFVVDDNVISEDGSDEETSPKKEEHIQEKKEKKKKKRRLIPDELDEDDMDLIEEQNRERKRIKKLGNMEIVDKFDDEIEPEEVDEEDFIDGGAKEGMRAGETTEKIEILRNYFFDEENEELPNLNEQTLREKTIHDVIEPEEIEEEYESKEDKIIMKTDIPERLQIREKQKDQTFEELDTEGKKIASNELVNETLWIFEKMKKLKKNPLTEEHHRKILKTLEFIKIQHFEVMFLAYYRKSDLLPELQQNDLWFIYELDEEWKEFSLRKESIKKDISILESHMKISREILDLLNMTDEIKILDDVKDYVNYHLSKFIDPNVPRSIEETQLSYKRPIKKVFVREAIQHKLDQFSNLVGLSAEQLYENLQSSDGRLIHFPRYIDLTPEKLAEGYRDTGNYMVSDTLATLTSLCKFMASEIFNHPMIRNWARKIYYDNVMISTEPTIKGKKDLDVTNPNYIVKRITKRPIDKFCDDLWMKMENCEKDGLIKIKFCLPWDDDNRQFSDLKDEIYKRMGKFYMASLTNESSESEKHIVKQWNIVRGEVLKVFLTEFMYPSLEKILRKELSEISEKFILSKCGEKFNEMLNVSPFRHVETSESSVLSVVIDQSSNAVGKVGIVFADQDGEMIDSLVLKFFGTPPSQLQNGQVKKEYEADKAKFEKFLEDYKPDLIAVSANCLEARRIKQMIAKIIEERKEKNALEKIPFSCYGDNIVPQLFAKTIKAKREFKEFHPLIKEATSLARMMQNPLAEILNLWHEKNEKNAAFFIPLHPLQHLVKQQNLKQTLEKIAIEVVNSVGVDFNKILKHRHCASQLQFICGLGPRKSKQLLKTITNSPDFNKGGLRFRVELLIYRILEKNVYVNCAGFMKIKVDEKTDNFDFDAQTGGIKFEILDLTRIHPENYVLARKIAKDALEDEISDAECIAKIMKDSHKLKDLDLEDYANHLLTVKNKPNMIYLLNFIVKELTLPFEDPRRGTPEMKNEDLFYRLCKESPLLFKVNSFVTAKVHKCYKSHEGVISGILCRIMENGLMGNISAHDIVDKKEISSLNEMNFPEGLILKAKVSKISYEDFKVDLVMKPSDMKITILHLKNMFPNWEYLEKYFKINEEEDFPHVIESGMQKQTRSRYVPRKINHPKFKNISMNVAMDFLQDRSIGDFVIRPSSKGMDHLNITWKFYEKNIVHLDLKEGPKLPGSQMASKYYIGKDSFDSLDEVIEKYISRCNQIMKTVTTHKKFMKGELDIIENYMLEDRTRDNKRIPYYVGCFEASPQYVVLCYMLNKNDTIKEFIKVKPMGLFFHNEYFASLKTLIPWFKENFKSSEYQRYLKKVKAPYSEMETNKIENQPISRANDELWNATSPGPLPNENAFDRFPNQPRIKEERIKDERIKREMANKNSSICNTCGRSGHTANECYAKSKSNAPYNKQSSGYSQNQLFDKRRDYNRNDRSGSYDKFQNQNSRYGDNDRKSFNKGGRNDMYRSGGGNNGKLHCNNCNDDGHVYRDCPKKTKSNICYTCNEEGHFSNECPNRNSNRYNRSRSRSKDRGDRNYKGRNQTMDKKYDKNYKNQDNKNDPWNKDPKNDNNNDWNVPIEKKNEKFEGSWGDY